MTNKECPPHYWLVETPNGSRVNAMCKKCGAQKDYSTANDIEWSKSHMDSFVEQKESGIVMRWGHQGIRQKGK
tara:strand:+ start:6326 stop:6544 length:219 start_codon:yes stop_codon:yes gene_type:complete